MQTNRHIKMGKRFNKETLLRLKISHKGGTGKENRTNENIKTEYYYR